MSTIKAADWVAEFTNTAGTGPISLDGPIEGFAPFSVIPVDSQVYYTVQEGNDKEIGLGTIKAGGTLERTRIIASIIDGTYTKGGSAMSLKGFAEVYCTIPSELLNLIYDVKNKADSIPDSVANKRIVFGPENFTNDKIYTLIRDSDGDFKLAAVPISYTAASGAGDVSPAIITIDARLIQNLEATFKKAVTFEDVVNFNSDFAIGDPTSNIQKGFSSKIQNSDGEWSMVEFKPSPNGDSADIVFNNEAGQQGIMSIGPNGLQVQFGSVDVNITQALDALGLKDTHLQQEIDDLKQQIDNLPTGGGGGKIPYASETVVGGIRVIVKGTTDADRELYLYTEDYTPPTNIQVVSFLNGGAEDGASHWTNEQGVISTTNTDATPAEGSKYFSGGNTVATKAINTTPDLPTDTGSTYDELVAGSKAVKLIWKQSSYNTEDKAAVGVRQLSSDGSTISETIAPVIASPHGAWADRELIVNLASGVASIAVVIEFSRVAGNDSDGYIDDIQLFVVDGVTNS